MEMPTGASKDFLDHARAGQRAAVWAMLTLPLVAVAGGIVAELLDAPRAGAFVKLYAGSLVGGLLLGGLLGWTEVRSWARSLRDSWQAWMTSAQGAGSMGETADRAGALHIRFVRAVAGVLVVLNGAVLVASWSTLPPLSLTTPYGVLAVVTVVATGVGVGAALAIRLAEAWWCRSVEQQTLALVEQGRIGVWGVR